MSEKQATEGSKPQEGSDTILCPKCGEPTTEFSLVAPQPERRDDQ